MPTIPPNPLIPASLFVALLFVLAWSLRRRRADDHPVCRRCGFDLTGRPAGSSVCSECGADLNRRRAIRQGNRVRHWQAARWVAVPLLFCGAWLGRSGWLASQGLDLQADKPLWWLKVDARSKKAATRDAAVREFLRRLSGGKLSDAQVTALADDALAVQADASRPWTPLWGQYLEDAWDANRLSQDRWERYARQSFDFHLEFRKQVRRGDPVVARIGLVQPRTGPARLVADAYGFLLDGKQRIYDWRGDFGPAASAAALNYEKRLQLLPGQSIALWAYRRREKAFNPTPGDGEVAALDPSEFDFPGGEGPHSNFISLKVNIWDARTARIAVGFPLVLQADWTLLPADSPSVALRHDASLRQALQAAVKVNRVDMRLIQWTAGNRPDEMSALVDLAMAPTPVHTAFEIWLRHGDLEWKPGDQPARLVPKGERGELNSFGPPPASLSSSTFAAEFGRPGATVDVILRPTVMPALQTTDVTEIWGEEVVVKDVPVTFFNRQVNPTTRPSAATRPAPETATRPSP